MVYQTAVGSFSASLSRKSRRNCRNAASFDRFPGLSHRIHKECNVMMRDQYRRIHLTGLIKMPQISERIPATHRAAAIGIERAESTANFALRILSLPRDVNALPVRPFRVGITQSNISTPQFTASIRSSGVPTPIKYRGASAGICGARKSRTSYITDFSSPTLKPPIA